MLNAVCFAAGSMRWRLPSWDNKRKVKTSVPVEKTKERNKKVNKKRWFHRCVFVQRTLRKIKFSVHIFQLFDFLLSLLIFFFNFVCIVIFDVAVFVITVIHHTATITENVVLLFSYLQICTFNCCSFVSLVSVYQFCFNNSEFRNSAYRERICNILP